MKESNCIALLWLIAVSCKSLIIIICVSQIYALAKLECLNYWVTAPIHCSYQTNTGRNRGIGSFNYWRGPNAVTAEYWWPHW